MTITAQIIADSISPDGIRLTTMQLRYPRFIHAEFMTHRTFSRNASSSRAIPVKKMIEDLRRDPAMPVYWGSNKPGMQAGSELPREQMDSCARDWLRAMESAINYTQDMVERDLHKQIANRVLEPWAHINVVVTATDWDNFFALRRHPDAQPEIKTLADAMWDAVQESTPIQTLPGQWHLPYVDERELLSLSVSQKVSVARCARVSYLTHDGRQTTVEEDLALYERLVGSFPMHASPAEHQATPDRFVDNGAAGCWQSPNEHGNFRGWVQYRKTLAGENLQS